jgi:hypothetical protein
MHTEDSPLDRTPDLVAKIRALREQAEKEMDRFTCVADYDVRRVVGHGPKAAPVSDETVASSPAAKRAKKGVAKSVIDQTSMDFPPAPAERGADDGEEA